MDQNIRNKLNEIRQNRLESEKNLQANETSSTSNDKPLIIMALSGVATGLIIAWLIYLFLSTDDVDLIAQKSRIVIYENEIREANKIIEQLNDRVELLTGSISSLESEPVHTIEFMEDNKIAEKMNSTEQEPSEQARETLQPTLSESQASGQLDSAAASATAFIPTHVVKTRLNLRTSRSLDNVPIGILNTGTEVRYIDEVNGWYYVDTKQLGKGWCASEYLSPLTSP